MARLGHVYVAPLVGGHGNACKCLQPVFVYELAVFRHTWLKEWKITRISVSSWPTASKSRRFAIVSISQLLWHDHAGRKPATICGFPIPCHTLLPYQGCDQRTARGPVTYLLYTSGCASFKSVQLEACSVVTVLGCARCGGWAAPAGLTPPEARTTPREWQESPGQSEGSCGGPHTAQLRRKWQCQHTAAGPLFGPDTLST